MGILSFLIALASARLRGMPPPRVHDEFSYLLAADTFAHGRLTNPTHPLWRHFESFHIIQQPTCASKYPPGQGLILAAGQLALGSLGAGVWLSTALACSAILWMLGGWVPRRWALLGGLLAALHPLILTWNRCYWGGAVAAGGGALVLGALGRPTKKPRAGAGLALGLGLATLAISRPYEGLVLSTLVMATALVRVVRRVGPTLPVLLRRVVTPALIVVVPAAAAVAYYNFRVTGRIDRMPYQVHDETYAVVPIFVWQKPRPQPAYHHREMHVFYTQLLVNSYEHLRNSENLLAAYISKLRVLAADTFPAVEAVMNLCAGDPSFGTFVWFHLPVLVLQAPLTLCPYLLLGSSMRLATGMLLVFATALAPSIWTSPQYASPAIGLVFLLMIQSIRHLRQWRFLGQPVGRHVSWIALAMYLAWSMPFFSVGGNIGGGFDDWPLVQSMAYRARILARLSQSEGAHLVIVRYAPTHNVHAEWVYNAADIDRSKVVWARAMDASANRKLLTYFRDRRSWLVLADTEPPRLIPISPDDSGELRSD
jgi:hypothetical protein